MAKITLSKQFTIDHITKIGMIKNNKILITKFFEKLNIMNASMTDNVWEAIKIACYEIYPKFSDQSETITQRQAAKYLDEKISRQTLVNKAKAGYIRMKDSQFYLDEIKQIKVLLDLADILIDQKIILPTQDVSGKDVYAIIPTSITAKGKSQQDQKIIAFYHAVKSPFIQKFLSTFHEDIK